MEMHMINDLVRDPTVILQDIIVLGAGGDGEAFRDGLFHCTAISVSNQQ